MHELSNQIPSFFFFNDTATPEIYTLSLHDALPIWFSGEIFAMREALNHRELVYSVDEGIDHAKRLVAAGQRPVVLLEHPDRLPASTYVLREVLRQQLPRTVVPYIWDPKAAAAAVAAGKGAVIKLS